MSKDQNAPLARRQEELLQLVEAKGQMSVDELARHFGVSDDTIRRDLQHLEGRKVLLRTHGGAVSTALLVHRETPFLTRAHAHADAKAKIGRAAAELISDGETLIINGGSGVSSLTTKDGLSTTVFEEASMVAQMISCARRIIVLADESKFGIGAFAQIAPLAAIDILVTDASPQPDLSQAKVKMIVATS
jgi:DeoR/GlpR family transcriptional regulator of sugar metabolism